MTFKKKKKKFFSPINCSKKLYPLGTESHVAMAEMRTRTAGTKAQSTHDQIPVKQQTGHCKLAQ